MSVFSSHINQNHLDECLSQLFLLYCEIHRKNLDLLAQTSYIEIEALQLLLSKNVKGINRALLLPYPIKSNRIALNAIEISMSISLGNFIRAHRIAQSLPLFLQLAYRVHFSCLRTFFLEIYERGHRTPQGAKFPLEKLTHYLLFDSLQETADFCLNHGLQLDDTSSFVIFKTGTILKINHQLRSNPCDQSIQEKLNNVKISDMLYGQGI